MAPPPPATPDPRPDPRPGPHPAPVPPPLSPRRRRLRHTLQILGTLAAVGLIVGIALAILRRPRRYEPGEASSDVTSELSKRLPADAPKPRLPDITAEAGLASFKNFAGTRTSQLPEDNGPGLAFGDFDNDGDDDVFLVSAGGSLNLPEDQLAPCALYENLGQGRFRKFAGMPEVRVHGMAAAWADVDSDGFQDLLISGYNALLLFRNAPGADGRRFVRDERFPNPPGYWSGLAWGDFDNDKDLDLYVCGYVQYHEDTNTLGRVSSQVGVAVPYTLNPSSYEPGLNLLLKNNGDGTFDDVAPALGVTNPTGRSLGAIWHDFDDDGWLDLYVANDVSDNVLYHNVQGRFVEISHQALVADYRSAMGMAVGDYDRDGDDDLFIAHWVAQENALYQNLWADVNGASRGPSPAPLSAPAAQATASAGFERDPATGLYPLRFLDVADMKGLGQIGLPYVGWGCEFVDMDQDGWMDLLVANGNTIEHEGPPPKKLKPQDSFLFWSQQGSFFHNLAPLNPSLNTPHVSRGLAVSDIDEDGDMDVLIAHLGEGVQLLRNDMASGHWLKLRLRNRTQPGKAHGQGDGARVYVTSGGITHRRSVTGSSYLSQSSRVLHFGLGGSARVDRIEVGWQAGGTNVFQALDGDGTWEITEGEPLPRRFVPQTKPVATTASPVPGAGPAASEERRRLVAFWEAERAAMNAVKLENDHVKAIPLFKTALSLDPTHEDSRYYLAQSLAAQADPEGAIVELRELTRLNPQSHRAFQAWGTLRALFARNPEDLAEAANCLSRARALNPEETGALNTLAEVSLLQGRNAEARQQLEAVCRTNPRAAMALFLRGYVAWRDGQDTEARQHLTEARAALGKEWQPKGVTAEGDVKKKQHVEQTPLKRFFETWNGEPDPSTAYRALDQRLHAPPAR